MEEYQEFSLRGRVFQTIRERILNGEYQENEELREIAIGKDLGVSRTPVREALRQLELEGLVKIVPNKGAYVLGITEKDVKDVYMIRCLLEGLCARWAAENITNEKIDELEEIIVLSEFYLNKQKKDSSEHVLSLDGKFHDVLYEAADSKILAHILSTAHEYVRSARKTSIRSLERAEQSIKEHREILEAIKERDAVKAEQLSVQHMMNVMKNLQINLE